MFFLWKIFVGNVTEDMTVEDLKVNSSLSINKIIISLNNNKSFNLLVNKLVNQ